MSLLGDTAREGMAENVVEMIYKEQLENFNDPKIQEVLERLKKKVLNILPYNPAWADKYVVRV